MELYSERIIFNSEWNHFCFRKGPVKQKPGERKGREERGRETREEGKTKKGNEKERKVNVSTNVVNYPIKQFSLRFKNRNGSLLSQILIAFDVLRKRKSIYTSLFRSPGEHNDYLKTIKINKNMSCYL